MRRASPKGADEVALGGDTLDEIAAQVGETITVSLDGETRRMLVTGVVAFPVPGDGGSSATGAYLSPASVEALDLAIACEDSDSCTRTIVVALRPGSDPAAFAARHDNADADISVALPRPPGEVDRLTAVEELPRYLAVFLAQLVASVSRRAAGRIPAALVLRAE